MYFFDFIHYLIGLIIVIILLWCIIQLHNYFSKNKNYVLYNKIKKITQ
jgi:hypothetical protein